MESSAGVPSGLREEGRRDAAAAETPIHPRFRPSYSQEAGANIRMLLGAILPQLCLPPDGL